MPMRWVDVAAAETLRTHGVTEAYIDGQIIAIFLVDGQLHAIDGMCSHQGGSLAKGRVEHGCVTCPWHGWQYELATGIQTINRQPLQKVYPCRFAGERVEIELESPG